MTEIWIIHCPQSKCLGFYWYSLCSLAKERKTYFNSQHAPLKINFSIWKKGKSSRKWNVHSLTPETAHLLNTHSLCSSVYRSLLWIKYFFTGMSCVCFRAVGLQALQRPDSELQFAAVGGGRRPAVRGSSRGFICPAGQWRLQQLSTDRTYQQTHQTLIKQIIIERIGLQCV